MMWGKMMWRKRCGENDVGKKDAGKKMQEKIEEIATFSVELHPVWPQWNE